MERIKMLKMLLPKRLPIARSTASIFTADTETTNSGREVEKAIKIYSPNQQIRVTYEKGCQAKNLHL
jgi:hypothetical protein